MRLMHRLGGYQSGRIFLIERGALVRALEAIAAGEPYRFEAGRRERLALHLEETRRALKARRAKISVAPDVQGQGSRRAAGDDPSCPWASGNLLYRSTGSVAPAHGAGARGEQRLRRLRGPAQSGIEGLSFMLTPRLMAKFLGLSPVVKAI